MELPKFLLASHSDFEEDIFVVHTEFPRFVINLKNDEVVWFEEFEAAELADLEEEMPSLIQAATAFYDAEINRYGEDD